MNPAISQRRGKLQLGPGTGRITPPGAAPVRPPKEPPNVPKNLSKTVGRQPAQRPKVHRTPHPRRQGQSLRQRHHPRLSNPRGNPLAPGTLLHTEDPSAFQALLDEYVVTYQPQHRDEYDLLTEAVYAKWRQQRLWIAETHQLEIAIAENEADLQKSLPTANIHAHLANGVAHSERVLKLYLRYDAQFRRHYRQCLNDLRDLQNNRQSSRLPPDDLPSEPTPAPAPPNEPNSTLTPETAGLKKFDEYRAHPLKIARTAAETAHEPGPQRER